MTAPKGSNTEHGNSRLKLASWMRHWTYAWTLLTGVLALLWVLLRTGSKPSRYTYPCQQAAYSTAALALGAPLTAFILAARRRIARTLRSPLGVSVALVALLVLVGIWGIYSRADVYTGPRLDPPLDYRAQVFHVTDCQPPTLSPRFPGLDNLLALMGSEGLKFYQSLMPGLKKGPWGIVGADDVVVIKINYQWPERGGTNVDLLRGLIYRIVNHPDSFTGEVVVCENSQFNSIDGFDRSSNNAEANGRSPHDVVVEFQNQGFNVSHYDWTVRQHTEVGEYSTGDMTDGYIRYDYDSGLGGRISYPKFQTVYGTYVSLKYGIWNSIESAYDREQLKFINLPVLKSHHATYGATACVKNYMGVVTGSLSTNSHNAIRTGVMGALLGEIQLADLNILDCIWINANPYDGPWTSYSAATREDQLVASIDPVAADIWSVKNILIPAFIENGYSPPWPYPSADPDDPTSEFREYLDNSMSWILLSGQDVTNNLFQVDVSSWDGSAATDCNTNGIPDEWESQYSDRNHNGQLDECETREFRQLHRNLGG